MIKLHIDDIIDPALKKRINNPGPGQHELEKKWILPQDTLLEKSTPQYSFGKTSPKNDHFKN